MRLEKADWLADQFGVNPVAQIGDGGKADVLHDHRADEFREALDHENYDERDGKNRPGILNS